MQSQSSNTNNRDLIVIDDTTDTTDIDTIGIMTSKGCFGQIHFESLPLLTSQALTLKLELTGCPPLDSQFLV